MAMTNVVYWVLMDTVTGPQMVPLSLMVPTRYVTDSVYSADFTSDDARALQGFRF
jgi:hypothetical protein